MEDWIHFPLATKAKPVFGAELLARAKDWIEADSFMSECVIHDDDLCHPEEFVARMGMTKHIAEALGVSNPRLLKCCRVGTTPAAPVRSDHGEGQEQGGGAGRKGKNKNPANRPGSESSPSCTANATALPRPQPPQGNTASAQSERSTSSGVAPRVKARGLQYVRRVTRHDCAAPSTVLDKPNRGSGCPHCPPPPNHPLANEHTPKLLTADIPRRAGNIEIYQWTLPRVKP